MSTISPSESQNFKELVTPFQPMGRLLVGTDLRGTQCDRFGRGELRLVGYGDSSGGYAFSPSNQDAAIAPSLGSSNLSNISQGLPRITEVQDFGGKWIDTITLHALDEFIEQTEPQSFIANVLRIFSGGQKDFRGDGNASRFTNTQYTLIAEIPIPALTRADVPRSFTVKVGAYIPPAQNIYLGLAIQQPYTCSFEMWDLQANTGIGSGISSNVGGSSSVGNGNDLNDALSETPADTNFILPIRFASATWVRGAFNNPEPPPPSTNPPINGLIDTKSKDKDEDPSKPSPTSPSSPSKSSKSPEKAPTPPDNCVPPVQGCEWYKAPKKSFSPPNIVQPQNIFSDGTVVNVGAPIEVPRSSSVGGSPNVCPEGTVDRGFVQFASQEFAYVLCCTPAVYPPNGLGCTNPTKWSCVSGGTCVQDALGTYNSQAECEAALVPAGFTGGQCAGINYNITISALYALNGGSTLTEPYSVSGIFPGQITGREIIQVPTQFPFTNLFSIRVYYAGGGGIYDFPLVVCGPPTATITNTVITRSDGLSDTCGNAPPTCP